EGARWHLGRNRAEIGYAPESAIELNRIGELKASQETAFEVTARDSAGRPWDDLPLDQRWRGYGYADYSNGKWNRLTINRLNARPANRSSQGGLPDFGPGTVTLEYQFKEQVHGVVLAEPVYYEPGGTIPVVCVLRGSEVFGFQHGDTSFFAPTGR